MAIVWEEIKMSPGSLLSICQEERDGEERQRGRRRRGREGGEESGEGERWILISSGVYLCVYIHFFLKRKLPLLFFLLTVKDEYPARGSHAVSAYMYQDALHMSF